MRQVLDSNVPQYTIDLSLPPRERYKSLVREYKTQIQDLTPLFDSLLADLGIAEKYRVSINRMAALLLRSVNSRVETAELRGISDESGIPIYLLVSFNVVLDLLMGCTSGAVRSKEQDETQIEGTMLHFRTLDWGMDPLRKIVVQLNFIRSTSDRPQNILARSVTYVGFVGVLTGVRTNLSFSLNFRALHNAATRRAQFRFYMHHLLVLLGLRQSISSVLRSYLFTENADAAAKDLEQISSELSSKNTTAAYLIFCNGQEAIIMEKDFDTAITRRSSSFIVATNHDVDGTISQPNATTPAAEHGLNRAKLASLQELIDESKDRMDCIGKKWRSEVRKHQRASRSDDGAKGSAGEVHVSIPGREAIRWVSAWPTTNETTHYATVLDPRHGRVLWAHAYPEPITEPV